MELITSPKRFETEFSRLLSAYSSFYWATAWASSSPSLFKKLVARQSRIKRVVVGLHFYQTHPDFIEQFASHAGVRFIKQTDGTFHPKLYLFYDDDAHWELLVGSGNFTNEAFTSNSEAVVLITSADPSAAAVLLRARNYIDREWQHSAKLSAAELIGYRTAWKNLRSKLNSLSGKYGISAGKKGKAPSGKPMFNVPVATMPWKTFVSRVRQDRYDSLEGRLSLLDQARSIFEEKDQFSDFTKDERRLIAGLPTPLHPEPGWFGSMAGNGKFFRQIDRNNVHISRALDSVPLAGQITRAHYDAFLDEYRKAFKGNFVATATRLLTLKRPDIFVCLDAMNKRKLCKAFAISQSDIDYQRYWDDIIERIRDSEWWREPKPASKLEHRISEARAALLDSLYYDHG